MKKRRLLYVCSFLLLIFLFSGYFYSEHQTKLPDKQPSEWFFMQRAFPFGQINHDAYIKTLKQAEGMRAEANLYRNTGKWDFAGPINTGGRITDVEMHPSDLNTIYIGAASGGVFKSTDQGISWEPIFDEALSLSIGDIAIAPSNSNIIYVGTGEANAGGGSLAYDGVGVYRSDDAGGTWEHIGLEESRNIGRMVVDSYDPDVLYVAAMGNLFANTPDRGIFKTINGGQSWEKVLYVSDSTGAIDIVIHPYNPDTLYAAMWERIRRPDRRSYGGPTCGIYRSYDGGKSWVELTNGLPVSASAKGRIGIDISVSDPNILYAIYADRIGVFNGVYVTIDGGDTWTQTNDAALSNAYSAYGWWFGRIKVDPVDPDNVFVIGFDIYRTQDGGLSWSNQSGNYVHVDQHAAYIHPLDNDFVVLGNDGGLYLSYDGGTTWNWNETLPITQFYTCEIDNQMPWRLYGGSQDNSINRTITGSTDDWETIYGGDGFVVLVDPTDNNYVYAESQYGNLGRSTNGGYSFSNATSGISGSDRINWNCPVIIDPTNPQILYYGSNRLYRSTNRAVSWTAISSDLTNGQGNGNLVYNTLSTIAVSAVNNQIIYTGADDGNVNVSLDGGSTWENVSDGLPERWITKVATDPFEISKAYVTISGYRWDEYMPHVFKTEDYGQTWEDISSGLPEAPVNDIIINPANNNVIFVATDVGVYYTYDGGGSWDILGDNLPKVVVSDIVYNQPTNKLVAGTYGRSMYTYDLEQDPVTGIRQNDLISNVEIYPNPFRESISIKFNNIEPYYIVNIYDISGKIVKTVSGKSERITWNGTDENGNRCEKGVYFCNINTGKGTLTSKVILQ